MTTLYLVRHGETEENAARILQGHMPGHLSASGVAQLRALRDELLPVAFDAVVCSDLKRCVDSARILTEGRALPVSYTSVLRERDWGSLAGKPIDSLQGGAPFPDDVESVDDMLRRAAGFLDFMREHYAGRTVMVVSHGLFCRAIRSAYARVPMKDIDRMQNATYRVLTLD